MQYRPFIHTSPCEGKLERSSTLTTTVYILQSASRKAEFKHSSSLPRDFSAKPAAEQADSEYESCESKELSGTSTWHTAKSSLRERPSGYSDGPEAGDVTDSPRKLSSGPLQCERQKTMPSSTSSFGDILDANM